jgi:hypothetical protein
MTMNKKEKKMDAMEKLKAAKAVIKKAKTDAQKVVKQAFKEACSSLFEENPQLESFRVVMYTPWFNDGDTCEFSAHTCEPVINLRGQNTEEDDDDDENWGYYQDDDPRKKLQKKVAKFLANFEDDDYKSMFGDHCQVIITKDKIEVQEYEHD